MSHLKSFLYYFGLVGFVVVIVFILFSMLPADPARLMSGVNASEEAVATLRNELGFNAPPLERFIDYLQNLAYLDFGTSYATRQPVAPEVWDAFSHTLTYVLYGLGIAIVYSLITLIISYISGSKINKCIQAINAIFTSIPSIIVAIIIAILFLSTGLLAFIDSLIVRIYTMAALSLAVYPACTLSQILIDEFNTVYNHARYIEAVKSFGFGERRIFYITLRNALLPWLAQISNVAASMIFGSMVIEIIFSLPGIGQLVLQSVMWGDFPMIQGIILVTSISFLLFNYAMESLYKYLLPLSDEY